MKKKKYGGIIKGWQLHKLSFKKKDIEKVYPGAGAKPMVFTGSVVKDPTGRWQPGHHMRSSLIVKIEKINSNKHKVETLNTRYVLEGPGNSDVVPNLGNGVMSIFY